MKTIEFEIISTKNPQIHQNGYVEVPSDENEMPEWFYYNQSGMAQPTTFTHHDGIGITQIGATDEQSFELDEFYKFTQFEEVDWIDDVILNSAEGDCKSYRKGNILINIGDGAKFESNIFRCNDTDWDCEYFRGFRLFFNQDCVSLNNDVFFEDPFTFEEIAVADIYQKNGMYFVEVPKQITDDPYDFDENSDILKEYKKAFENSYKKSLVYDLGAYGLASSYLSDKFKSENDERIFDEDSIQEYGNSFEDYVLDLDIICLEFMTPDELEKVFEDWRTEEEE